MAAISDIPVTPMSESMHISSIVLLDAENVGVAVGISLLSRIQAEIHIMSLVLPVTGRHLWFNTYPDVG